MEAHLSQSAGLSVFLIDCPLNLPIALIGTRITSHFTVMKDPRTGELVDKDLWVTRKGATSAKAGELGVIPGSMGCAACGILQFCVLGFYPF